MQSPQKTSCTSPLIGSPSSSHSQCEPKVAAIFGHGDHMTDAVMLPASR